MSKPVRALSRELQEVAESVGLELTFQNGGRHNHVIADGKIVAIMPKGTAADKGRAQKNVVAQVRREGRRHAPPELKLVHPPRAKGRRKPNPTPPKPKPVLVETVRQPPPAQREETFTGLHGEPGWIGKFTRAQAVGALENGTRVVKLRGAMTDASSLGTKGTILGSVTCPDRPARLYFVEWDHKPREAVAVMGRKLGKLKP